MGKSYRRSAGLGYSSTVLSTFLGSVLLSCFTNAAPLVARSYSNSTGLANTTTTLPSVPVPTTVSTVYGTSATAFPQPLATLYPTYTSQYNGKTGAVDFDTATGLVSREPTNLGNDISTLVTFAIDSQWSQHTCQLVFDLESPSSWASGTKKAQLFTSLAPATADTTTWPSGNLRNQALGTIDIVSGGRATWEAGSGPGATSNGVFPCNAYTGPANIYAAEIAPQGDSDEISWPALQDGIKIVIY